MSGSARGGHGASAEQQGEGVAERSGEASEGCQGSLASSHREHGRGGGHANKHEGHAAAASYGRSAELQFEIS